MKNKIAIFIPQFYWGGMPKVASHLISELEKFYEIDLILVNSSMEVRENTGLSNVIRLRGNGLKKLLDLHKLLNNRDYKAVISFGIIDNLLNVLLNKTSKTILTEHSTKSFDNEIEPSKLKKLLYAIGMKKIYPKAYKVISVSRGIADDLLKMYNVDSEVIYNPIKIDLQTGHLEEEDVKFIESLKRQNKTLLLNAGRVTRPKGQMNLINSMQYLPNDIDLLILGEGPDLDNLKERTAELKLTARVHFLGYKKNIAAWMSAADYYVSMSWFEGFPTVLVESILSGTPIVSADIFSGPREILSNGSMTSYSDKIEYPKVLVNGVLSERFDFRSKRSDKEISAAEMGFARAVEIAMESDFPLQFDFVEIQQTINEYRKIIED